MHSQKYWTPATVVLPSQSASSLRATRVRRATGFGGWNSERLAEQLSGASVHDPELEHWIVKVKGLRVDNERLDSCDDEVGKAAVDTGTALLSVPQKAFRQACGMLRHVPGLSDHGRGAGPALHFESAMASALKTSGGMVLLVVLPVLW